MRPSLRLGGTHSAPRSATPGLPDRSAARLKIRDGFESPRRARSCGMAAPCCGWPVTSQAGPTAIAAADESPRFTGSIGPTNDDPTPEPHPGNGRNGRRWRLEAPFRVRKPAAELQNEPFQGPICLTMAGSVGRTRSTWDAGQDRDRRVHDHRPAAGPHGWRRGASHSSRQGPARDSRSGFNEGPPRIRSRRP